MTRYPQSRIDYEEGRADLYADAPKPICPDCGVPLDDPEEGCDTCNPYMPRCPACGELIDYCAGHGPIADPRGWALLIAHDADDHRRCNPLACPLL